MEASGDLFDKKYFIPGPADRETFFEAQRRCRRRVFFHLLAYGGAILMLGALLSAMVTPLVILAALMLGVVLAFAVPGILEPFVASSGSAPAGQAMTSFEIIQLTSLFLMPGAIICCLLWLLVRALLIRSGVDGILLKLNARNPRLADLEEKQLQNLVEEASIAAGVKSPRLMMLDEEAPNAAIMGTTDENSTVVVTRGLLDRYNRDETQGVIAHLIASEGHGDLRLSMLLLSVFQTGGLLALVLQMPFGLTSWRTFGEMLSVLKARRTPESDRKAGQLAHHLVSWADIGQKDDLEAFMDRTNRRKGLDAVVDSPRIFLGFSALGVKIIVNFVSQLFVYPALSLLWRNRKYLADAAAVQLTRNPNGLASAMAHEGRLTGFDAGRPVSHLFAGWPAQNIPIMVNMTDLSACQPLYQKRLSRLRKMGAEVELKKTVKAAPPTTQQRLWTAFFIGMVSLIAVLMCIAIALFIYLNAALMFFVFFLTPIALAAWPLAAMQRLWQRTFSRAKPT